MRGTMMKMLTAEQHTAVLTAFPKDAAAAKEYTSRTGQEVSPQLVRYWRKVFTGHKSNMAKADRELKQERVLRRPDPSDDFDPEGVHLHLDSIRRSLNQCVLVIPDQHAPYQHPDALSFLKTVADKFQPDAVVNLGDELDYHALSFHDSDPNLDAAGAELEKGKAWLRDLAIVFPDMFVCHSNHGSMVYRRGKAHGIPVQAIKSYRDIIFPTWKDDGVGAGWAWAHEWHLSTGEGYLGTALFRHQASSPLLEAAHEQSNLWVGHNHGRFQIEYAASSALLYYGATAGCLVDRESLAFAYGKNTKNKPILGCGLILNGRPFLIPMELDRHGRWKGHL